MITVEMAGEKFDVKVNGDVYQPRCFPQFVLDEVRLTAAAEYLSAGNKLTKDEREYWQNAARKTDLTNFRGRGKR